MISRTKNNNHIKVQENNLGLILVGIMENLWHCFFTKLKIWKLKYVKFFYQVVFVDISL